MVNEYNKGKMINILRIITEVLTYNHIDYTIMYGTLLGCIRDNNIIDGDNDLDLSVVNFDKIDWNELYRTLKAAHPTDDIKIYRSAYQPFRRTRTVKVGNICCDISELIEYGKYYKHYLAQYSTIQNIIIRFIKKNKHYDSLKYAESKKLTILKTLFWSFSIPRYKLFIKRPFCLCIFKNIKVNIPINYGVYLYLIYNNWTNPMNREDYLKSKMRKKHRKVKKI